MQVRTCWKVLVLVLLLTAVVVGQDRLPYRTYTTFADVLQNATTQYDKAVGVTSLGTSETPTDHGFFFYNCPQFDSTGRYMLAMRVFCRERKVLPNDIATIGVVDLKDNNRWIEVGKSTAWNWQQGCRMQWRPNSDEILWNDRDDAGTKFVCRACDFRTKQIRTLPRPIYAVSPDGSTALTHDFERMQHGGTDYVGLSDPNANDYAPRGVGIWKMNLDTGDTKMIASLADVVKRIPPEALPDRGPLYFFREGWNLTGSRFIAFVKAPGNRLNKAFSMAADGSDLRYLYHYPSHHCWMSDRYVMDFAHFGAAVVDGDKPEKGFFLYEDDDTGIPARMLWRSDHDGHSSRHPNGDWVISDTYPIEGWQYLFLFHLPSRKFVSLGKFAVRAPQSGIFRVDLHPRISPDGNTVSIDSTHESPGRQIYNIDISHIVTAPPKPSPTPVIIDTDIGGGIDDAFALAAAIMSPELEIRGITIAGSEAGTRARIVGRFLENTAHPRIPVAIGSSDESRAPIDGQRQFARRAGFRGPTCGSAIEFMYEQLKRDPGKITIVCLGSLINVAELIEKYPEAKSWIRNLIVSSDQSGDTLAKIREANIPMHGKLPGTISPRLTERLRKRVFASHTPLSYNLESLAELSGEDGPSLRGACMIQLVRSPDEPVSTPHSGTDSRPLADPDRVIDPITRPSPDPRYMPNHVPIVIGGGSYHRLCGYPIEEKRIGGLLKELVESLGKPGTIELRVEPDSNKAALDRLAKLCREVGWTDPRVTLVKRTVSRPIDRKGLPHRVHVFENYETDIERRWWLAGEPTSEILPSGSTRAIRAMPCRNFDGKMGDFYRPHRAVIFNPVPGPPMGPRTRLGFRYHLTGTDRIRVQIYSLSNGYHRSLTLTDLSQGAWHSTTVDMTEARRPDGSGGPLAKDERIDDIQFYVDPEGELLVDYIVLYDEAPENERRPFPKQIIFTGWFDTGKQGSEWPGDFEIVPHEPPQGWSFARSVSNEKTKAPWIRVHLRGRRPLAEEVCARFRCRVKDSVRLTVELYDSQTGSDWKQVVDDLIPNEWVCAEEVFDLSSILEEERFGDEIRFHVDPGCELRIDDLLLYVPETSHRGNL